MVRHDRPVRPPDDARSGPATPTADLDHARPDALGTRRHCRPDVPIQRDLWCHIHSLLLPLATAAGGAARPTPCRRGEVARPALRPAPSTNGPPSKPGEPVAPVRLKLSSGPPRLVLAGPSIALTPPALVARPPGRAAISAM